MRKHGTRRIDDQLAKLLPPPPPPPLLLLLSLQPPKASDTSQAADRRFFYMCDSPGFFCAAAIALPACRHLLLASDLEKHRFSAQEAALVGLWQIVDQTNEQSPDNTSNKIKPSHRNNFHKHTNGISCKTDGIEKYQTARPSPEIFDTKRETNPDTKRNRKRRAAV